MFKRKKKKTGCETPKFRRHTAPPQYEVPPMPPVKPPTSGSNAVKPRRPCPYETPCGWCAKWDKKCDRKIGCDTPSVKIDTNEPTKFITYKHGIACGTIDFNTRQSVIIQTQNLKLLQTDLGLTIDVPFDALCKIETIEINGIKFVKENQYD